MILQKISSYNPNSYSTSQINIDKETTFGEGVSPSSNNSEEKEKRAKQYVKSVYTKGFLTGAASIVLIGAADWAINHFGEKAYDKITDKKSDTDLADLIKNEKKEIEKVTLPNGDEYIPILSTLKKIVGKLKK